MQNIKSLDELKKEILKEKKQKETVKETVKETIKENKKEETEIELGDKVIKKVSEETKISEKVVKTVVKLLSEGCTIPFIARYRKEMTGSLSDASLRELDEVLKKQRNILKRKDEILRLIDETGNLTEEIKEEIEKAETISRLEDIYRPYKGKRKTRGSEAKRKGLEELSKKIIEQNMTESELYNLAKNFLNKEVLNEEEALLGAGDIIAENISNDIYLREEIRNIYLNKGIFKTSKKEKAEDEEEIYKMYYEYSENVKTIPSHRILASLRGENEKILNVKIDIEEDKVENLIAKKYIHKNSKIKERILNIIKDSFERLIKPSVEREVKNILKEKADEIAIQIFKQNLKSLLMSPPFKNVRILGMDPGFRTGCKLAVIDESGKVLDYGVIYPAAPKEKIEEAEKIMLNLIEKWNVDIISIGNGTASRETEKFVSDLIKENNKKVKYIITSESGASVYSASKIGEEEFPNLDVTIRGAISIARRISDPMAEFVKIDPKSIGVGQYQHDVDQKNLEESLKNSVEDIVNKVGVDLNTATYSLLSYVSGLSKKTAKNIVKFRDENGKFLKRENLKKVSGIGDVTYNQSVGFLRIYEGDIFDSTGIHPESYDILDKLLKKYDIEKEKLKDEKIRNEFVKKIENEKQKIVKEENIGIPTIEDIILELKKPGRDIRDEAPKPILREDVLSFEDIKIGQKLKGTVRNVTAFGAFVDIGIKNDGLVHISEMSKKFVKDPKEIVKLGDIVNVIVIDKNDKTKKVSLSMKID